jgi:hypothetical protein
MPKSQLSLVPSYTVTRIDVIFRYPDRVPLTHFVHRAKKVFSMGAWILCWVFCATGIFRRCNGKMFEHRGGANLLPSDYDPSVLPLRHCSLVFIIQKTQSVSCWDFPAVSVVTGSRIFRPYLVVTCRDFPAVSAVTGSRIFRPYQVVTCRDFPAVSAVTGSRIFRPYL